MERTYTGKSPLPKVGDAILFRNHNKTGFASNFLPGYHVVQKIDDSNYVIKHTIFGQTSQVHIKDLIVSPMIWQVLENMPPAETFGCYGKYANCPQMAQKDLYTIRYLTLEEGKGTRYIVYLITLIFFLISAYVSWFLHKIPKISLVVCLEWTYQ